MSRPTAILDAVAYFCRVRQDGSPSWSVTPGQRLVASWNDGWQGGLGEVKRKSADRYLYGEKIDTSTAGYLRTHPQILGSIENADIDATLPVYVVEGKVAAAATITFDAFQSSAVYSPASTVIWTHTVGNNADRILYVSVFYLGDTSAEIGVSGVTWDWQPLTFRSSRILPGGVGRIELWYLVAPHVQVLGAITVTFLNTNHTRQICASESWYNVSQTAPFHSSTATGDTSTVPSVTVTSAAGYMVLDFIGVNGDVIATVGAGQTLRYNISPVPLSASSSEAGAASVVMDWSLSASSAWASIGVSVLPANARIVNVLNGRYRYKINASSWALMGKQDYGAGAQCGRPELFESAHYIPLGATVDARKLSAFGAGNETTDTDAAIAGSIKAHAFCAVQDAGTAKLARALANSVNLSANGADWSASGFEAGDSTFTITDLLSAPGEIVVIRPDGAFRFDASGSPLPITGFEARDAAADVTLGSNSQGHGPYSYVVTKSSLWRILGENATPMAPEADPDFGAVALNGQTFPLAEGQWRSVTAIDRWLYATHYSSLGNIDGDLFYGYIGSDGLVQRWHGSLYDSDKPLRVQRLSIPALVIVEGKPGDSNTPAIRIMALASDGSPRTALDGKRAAVPGTGKTTEHFAIMAGLDWGWLGFADREKQLARISFRTQGMVTGASWQMNAWRDSNVRQTVGSAITANGLNEVKPAVAGTSDDFYTLYVAPYCTLTASFTGFDPRLAGLTAEARLAALITTEIEIRRNRPAPNIGFEEALSNLRKLAGGARIAAIAPERTNALNVHVVGVAEQQIGDVNGDDFGFLFTVTAETFDQEAGAT